MIRRKKKSLKKRFRLKKKKPFFKKKVFWVFVFIFLGFGFLIYFLVFSQTFQVKEIRVFGNEKVSRENLQELIEAKAKRTFFLQTKSIFLVDLRGIEETILAEFPLIAEAKLKRKFPNILSLEIRERKPLATFCQDSKECFKIDKEGVAFLEAKEEQKEGCLLIFSQKEEKISLGQRVIQEDHLGSIFEIQKNLEEDFKIKIEKFFLLDEKLNVETEQGFEIYFDLEGDVLNQISNLGLILQEEIPPEERKNLQYIDLRFGNRVFYK